MPLAGNTILSIALVPSARAAAIGVSEESYDVSTALAQYKDGLGNQLVLVVGDLVAVSTPVVMNTNVAVVGARVASATNIAIQWGNFTAVANVPPPGTYKFLIQRSN